jgi:hypothetical protein
LKWWKEIKFLEVSVHLTSGKKMTEDESTKFEHNLWSLNSLTVMITVKLMVVMMIMMMMTGDTRDKQGAEYHEL